MLYAGALSAALAGAYLAWQPPSADLSAQFFRADEFSAHGLEIWNNAWYSGHYLAGYSLVSPALGALMGPPLLGAVVAVVSAVAFAAIARRGYGDRALPGSLWFAAGTATLLLTGRITFALGIAIALLALLALPWRGPAAPLLGAAAGLASPVAGLFVALAAAASAYADRYRGKALALALAALGATVGLSFLFPAGGDEPFPLSPYLKLVVFCLLALWLIPADERVLRAGIAMYLAVATLAFAIPNALGDNAVRLGTLFGGPVLALALFRRRTVALILLALPLIYWQWWDAAREVARSSGNPAASEAYFAPLLSRLASLDDGTGRIEIPPTIDRGEARFVAPRFPLGRGWLRQEESSDIDEFTDGHLTSAAYGRWLTGHGITYVALADAPLDYLAEDEADLIRGGLPYLEPVWSNGDWRLYRLRRAAGILPASTRGQSGDAPRLAALDPQSFAISAPRRGSFLVRIHYTPYWTVTGGDACVERDGDWTRIVVREPGDVQVAARFGLAGILGRDSECSA
ncbi:MAG: hypothetical protein ACJ75I_02330 [Solirubrobacterales bacterium]